MLDDPEFAPGGFLRPRGAHGSRAIRRPPEADALGDHVLNPGFLVDAAATYRDAAVLIPVVAREPQATVLLTLRTPHLSAHAGQIAFPGGKIDAGDAGAGRGGAPRGGGGDRARPRARSRSSAISTRI